MASLILNGQLAMLKAWKRDIPGALERTSRCVDIVVRYPGICRSPSGVHTIHTIASALASLRAKEPYDRVRTTYNRMQPEKIPIPPLEEWSGVRVFCNHYFCRSMEKLYPSDWNESPAPSPEPPRGCVRGGTSESEALNAETKMSGKPGVEQAGVLLPTNPVILYKGGVRPTSPDIVTMPSPGLPSTASGYSVIDTLDTLDILTMPSPGLPSMARPFSVIDNTNTLEEELLGDAAPSVAGVEGAEVPLLGSIPPNMEDNQYEELTRMLMADSSSGED